MIIIKPAACLPTQADLPIVRTSVAQRGATVVLHTPAWGRPAHHAAATWCCCAINDCDIRALLWRVAAVHCGVLIAHEPALGCSGPSNPGGAPPQQFFSWWRCIACSRRVVGGLAWCDATLSRAIHDKREVGLYPSLWRVLLCVEEASHTCTAMALARSTPKRVWTVFVLVASLSPLMNGKCAATSVRRPKKDNGKHEVGDRRTASTRRLARTQHHLCPSPKLAF